MSIKTNHHEKSLVLIKPDGVQRGLIGEVITRFERKGLKVVAMKMIWPDKKKAMDHYFWSDEEKEASGGRTIEAYKAQGYKITKSAKEYAEDVQRRLYSYLQTGPIVAMVIEGAHAIEHVRKVVGHGNPLSADVGSIRADFTIDSYVVADDVDRAARNLIHASGNPSEAAREMSVWFKDNEIVDYDLAIEKILYSKEWEDERKDLVKGD
ncbi:nucleoside-diphosphate kinase [Candidatus Woesebacteria bacterium]|nr:MAG: nucleoside-diphosphate kinase [Candidatus Woesebacteria bacterium]